MLTYKEMRAALKASPEGVKLKNFTEAFYSAYCKAWRNGEWEAVYATDFYNLDGFSYCVFQEIFYASLPRWRLTFIKMDQRWPMDIARLYIHEDTEEAAKSRGMAMLERFDADYVDVLKVVSL